MVTIAMTGPPARLAYLTSCQQVFLGTARVELKAGATVAGDVTAPTFVMDEATTTAPLRRGRGFAAGDRRFTRQALGSL
jgi:hypothetical protein